MNDRFVIEKKISARNGADAYLAYDTEMTRNVRLRRIHSPMGLDQLHSIEDAFSVTQRQVGLVKSDYVLPILDSGVDEDGAWLSLPHYKNEQLLKAHKVPLDLAHFHRLATQLLRGLKAIHDQNLVHGALSVNSIDVIMSDKADADINYSIRDLGMRRLLILVQNQQALTTLPADVATLAPELFQKKEVEPSTDLYMLGHLLYYLLVGGHPFVGLDEKSALEKHLSHDIVLASTLKPDIPSDIAEWLDKLTQAKLEDRFYDAQEALDTLPFVSPKIKIQSAPVPAPLKLSAPVPPETSHLPTKEVINPPQQEELVVALSDQPSDLKSKQRKKKIAIVAIFTTLLLVGAVGSFFIFRSDEKPTIETNREEIVESSGTEQHTNVSVLKPVVTGTIGSDLKTTSSRFSIGTTPRAVKKWGSKKSKKATGPDIGAKFAASLRAYAVFSIADLIDADNSDDFVNVRSLTNMQIELSLKSDNKTTFFPMAYTPKAISSKLPAQVRSHTVILNNGSRPVITKKTYTFTFTNVDLSESSYDGFFIIAFSANKPPPKGQLLNFIRSSVMLKARKQP